jgi:imidazole glycerol-phosphate synthase subunit HisH
MITIINYGLGNLGSIQNMLKKIGVKSVITSDPEKIREAEKIILPGVGAFDTGMNNLKQSGLIEVLNQKAMVEKVPVLGICLGMQLMCNVSEEGTEKGLGWYDVNLVRFNPSLALKVPHMNWAYTKTIGSSKLFSNMPEESKFYHVHSYHIEGYPSEAILESDYHEFKFVSALGRDNILGVQFHPEKSHKYGMDLLQNFVNNF